ncbi:MAG TPA: autotransporter-associated beta strand repeat-containing protein [Chthoniobacter sp.]|nr:autotransporter-associated beta strand repeat-containing protein [Chthoniobacter sp.]
MSFPNSRICSRSILWLLLGAGIIAAGKVSADQTYDQTNASHVWDTGTANWNGNTTWINTTSNNAIFTGTAVTVDVNGAINAGNITFNSNNWNIGDLTSDGSLNLAAPSTITVTNLADTATISAAIASGGITKAGAGTLVLSGNNTYDGNVTVNVGALKVGSNTALGSTVGTTTVASGAAVILANGVTVTGETITPVGNGINSAGALEAEAGATATWAGTISLALLDASNPGTRIGAKDGGVLTVSGVIQNGTGNTLTVSGAPLAVVPGVVIISGTTNTYTGPTQIIRGILKIGATNALPVVTVLDVDQSTAAEDSTFDLNGFGQTVAALQRSGAGGGTGGSFITNNGLTPSLLTVNQTATTTYTGNIKDGTGTVALTKSGGGSLTLGGANTYSGATTVSAGTLVLASGASLNNTAISVTGGSFSEGATAIITGNSSFAASAGTSGLNGANTFTGTVTVSGSGVLNVNSNGALGSTAAGTTVQNGGRLVLNVAGTKVTGETLTVSGSGGNNFGGLQTAVGISAEWAGNIIVAMDASRVGPVGGGTLTITGSISTSGTVNSILFSRGGGTTLLNGVSTYTADTQMFSDAQGAATIKIGVDNAINSGSKLSVIASVPAIPGTMTLDLNGRVLTLKALDTSANYTSGGTLTILNSAASPASVLSLADPTFADTFNFSGILADGTGGLSLVKGGAYTQVLLAANTYTGSTTVNTGTLQVGGAISTLGMNAKLASTAFTLNGGTFALNNAGASNNNTDRISDSAVFTMKGGAFLFTGSDQTTTNSSETVGTFALNSAISKITVTAGTGNLATLTAGQITHTANSGIALLNGVGLGKDAISNVGHILVSGTAPTLVGTTDASNTGINAAAQNTKIVPYLLGEATSTTGGAGTITGTADTFVTYNATTGFRPLNPTDEFTQNAFVTGTNTRLTTTTGITLNASATINSLLLDGGALTIASGQTLKVSSGAILFSSGATSAIIGGTLDFGNAEGIITINSSAAANPTITAVITGTAGVSYYGAGTLIIGPQQSTYSGNTLLTVATVIPQTGSTGPAGAPTSGPFGTGTVILGGSAIRAATSVANLTIANPISFAADTTVPASTGTDQSLIFSGPVTLTGNRTLTQNTTAATVFSGNIGDGGSGFGLTFTGTGSGAVVLSGANGYTGATQVKGGTVVVSGSLTGSATTIGDATNLAKVVTFGGSGTVGSVTVGVAAGNSGAMLNPHAGTSTSNTGVTLYATSVTFASSARLLLQIGRSSAFTGSLGDGTAGGDVSDHLATTGALTLNGADLKLSLLTTGYTPVNGDIFFLTINSGGPISGTFASLNQVATNLGEGSVFSLGSQSYQITYLANFSGNSLSGGNDVALLAVVPEPGTFVSLFGGLGCLLGVQRMRRSRRGQTVRT